MTNITTQALNEQIRFHHKAAQDAAQTAIQHAIEAGRLLTEAKAQIGHGQWLPYVDSLGMTPRQAQRYMQLADPSNASRVSHFGSVREALKAIAKPKPHPALAALEAWHGLYFEDRDAYEIEGVAIHDFAWIEPAWHGGFFFGTVIGRACWASRGIGSAVPIPEAWDLMKGAIEREGFRFEKARMDVIEIPPHSQRSGEMLGIADIIRA